MLSLWHINNQGQGTLEATMVIPVLFLLMLVLLQPGIMLYDKIVMENAAAEGCRLAATATEPDGINGCKEFIRHRLSAVPQHELFHGHSQGCTWSVEVLGNEFEESTAVIIENKLQPLPLFSSALGLLGMTDESGYITLRVEHSELNQPPWLFASNGGGPEVWVAEW